MDTASSQVSQVPVSVAANDNYAHQENGIWPHGPVQLARGRQAKNPNAKTVQYKVNSLEHFEKCLRDYLNDPPAEPENTECNLSFWVGTSFLVTPPQHQQPPQQQQAQQQSRPYQQPQPHQALHAHNHNHAPPGYQPANGLQAPQYGHTYQSVADPAIALTLDYHASPGPAPAPAPAKDKPDKIPMSVMEALAPTQDPKDRMRRQRAIAKCCVDSIQKIDGFRYSFHNCWNSREDDSFRFSYYCNDSLLNKDRAANGKGAKLGKRATKPVYDCKGVLSVKFSATKSTLDVIYKHLPGVHKTYEERAPPPRRDSKRRKYLEVNDPEALIKLANRPRTSQPPEAGAPDAIAPPVPKKKKAKKKEESKQSSVSIESDLRAQSLRSLLELIQTDPEPARQPPQEPLRPQNSTEARAGAENHSQAQQTQPQPQQVRRRPRNSCDICKNKKTKCDGVRPVCGTCYEKGRSCIFSESLPGEDQRHSLARQSSPLAPHNEAIRQAQAAQGLSELEKMKRELEEAKARIQQLEEEKTRASTTPLQTPRQTPSISQPLTGGQHQSQGQSLSQSQQPQPQTLPQTLPQPISQSVPQAIPQPISQSIPQPSQQHMRTSQQLATPQYSHYNAHSSQGTYGVNTAIDYKLPSQVSLPQSTQQMQPSRTGLTPTQDTSNPYSRNYHWSAPVYNYQAPQQQPQEFWAASRYP